VAVGIPRKDYRFVIVRDVSRANGIYLISDTATAHVGKSCALGGRSCCAALPLVERKLYVRFSNRPFGVNTFRLSTTAISMSLAGSC
jgi:hypothetical protein